MEDEFVMPETTPNDYKKFIIDFGIVTTFILLEILENIEKYEECKKIIQAIDLINTKGIVYKEKRISDNLINESIETYIKMGFKSMTKEKILLRSRYFAKKFIFENFYRNKI